MKDISIIVPVWNAEDLLPRCLDSIVAQTLEHDRIEVILVDDGSTDSSGALCDEYARNHAMFRVIHMENSGGPAAPRNRGIEIATGEFVFFCDNDDYFGPEAAERMVAHARAWGSDVLLVKMGESGGQNIPRRVFLNEQPAADRYDPLVASTLGPWKLFRRKLVIDRGIRFPEDSSFDDSVFTLEALLLAGTISVANDYEYYYWVLRSDGGNLSGSIGDSAWRRMDSRLRGLQRLFALVDHHADRSAAERGLLPKLFGEQLMTTTMRRLPDLEPEDADRWAEELRALARRYYSPAVADALAFNLQVMYATLLQAPGSEALRAVIAALPAVPKDVRFREDRGEVWCEHDAGAPAPVVVRTLLGPNTLRSVLTIRNVLRSCSWREGALTFVGSLTLLSGSSLADATLELRLHNQTFKDRKCTVPASIVGTREETSAAGRLTATTFEWTCTVPRELFGEMSRETARRDAPGVRGRWDFDLVARIAGEGRGVRIGAERGPGVFAGFAGGVATTPSSVFVPDETGMKNLSLWEVDASSDLYGFRVPKNRPAANTELMTLLAMHDFTGALAAARRIEGGPSGPLAERWREWIKVAFFRGKRLARKVLHRIRKRLRTPR